MMADSGARGSMNQIRQLAGMRGLMANTAGKTIEMPIRANYREGLNILEYFISSRGARKGLADTALRTADSGYLTRRLVDVSQDVIVREEDCGSHRAASGSRDITRRQRAHRDLARASDRPLRRRGRCWIPTPARCWSPRTTMMIDDRRREDRARRHQGSADPQRPDLPVPRMASAPRATAPTWPTASLVNVGEAVGIIAAQSIGEPGTQLTMRTFHTGGIAIGGGYHPGSAPC